MKRRDRIAVPSMQRACVGCGRETQITDLRDGLCWPCQHPPPRQLFSEELGRFFRQTPEGGSIAAYRDRWPFG